MIRPHVPERRPRLAAWTVAALLLVGAGLLPSAVLAIGMTSSGAASAASPQAQSFEMTGKIVSVDYNANVIVVRSQGQVFSISITPTTAVEHDGQTGGVSDLRPGVRIHVAGTREDGVYTAADIVIKSKGSN